MSVVVKGMEMPTDCSNCVFKTVIGVDLWKCKASGEEFYAWDVGWGDKPYIRHSSCPLENLPSAQPSLYEQINEAHNEGYDVGYWAGRRDYEQKWIPVSERLQSAKPEALTDSEKRIFLAAMERERKICQAIDEALDNKECDT